MWNSFPKKIHNKVYINLPTVCSSAESVRNSTCYSRLRGLVSWWSPLLFLRKLFFPLSVLSQHHQTTCFIVGLSHHTLPRWQKDFIPAQILWEPWNSLILTDKYWLLRMLKLLYCWIHNAQSFMARGSWFWNPPLQIMSRIYDANLIKWHNISFTVNDIKGLPIINMLDLKFSPQFVLDASETLACETSVHH